MSGIGSIVSHAEFTQSLHEVIGYASKVDSALDILNQSLEKRGMRITPEIRDAARLTVHSLHQISHLSEELLKQFEQLQNLVTSSAQITSFLQLDMVLEQVV